MFYNRIVRYFSSQTIDPYKLLGLSKLDDFQEIKKSYLKMVKEYHPDKNEKNKELFIAVKSAFEQIKLERGLTTKKNLYKSDNVEKSEFKSRRPKYNKETHEDQDFEELYRKSQKNENYQNFKKSFDVLRNIETKDLKYNLVDYKMPNSFNRFGIKSINEHIKYFSDNSFSIFGYVLIIILAFIFISQYENENMQISDNLNSLENLNNEKEFVNHLINLKKINKKDKDFSLADTHKTISFDKEKDKELINQRRMVHLPRIHNFIKKGDFSE